jgi:hypothetical protein
MKTVLFSLLGIGLFGFSAKAQNYTFTQFTASYNDLQAPIVVTGGVTWDDPEYSIPIGFPFKYFQLEMDTLFGAYGVGAELFSKELPGEIISFLSITGYDLIDMAYDSNLGDGQSGGLSQISYLLTGNPGSRILKIEWKNCGFYGDNADDNVNIDFINFQTWIYESDLSIEVRMGPSSITQPDLCYDGETGGHVALFDRVDMNTIVAEEGIVLTGPPATASSLATTSIFSNYLDGDIPDGKVYRFAHKEAGLTPLDRLADQIELYPNPTKDLINISIPATIEFSLIQIQDLSGKTVASSLNQKQFNVQEFETGVYLVNVTTKDGMLTKKFVKQ